MWKSTKRVSTWTLVQHPAGVVRVAEQLEGVAVPVGDRRAGQAEELGVGQRGAHIVAQPALLGAVGLVDQHDDVGAPIEQPRALEPEYRRDDDAALVLGKQSTQLLLGLGLPHAWQAGGAKLPKGLLDQVEPVQHDHDGRPARSLIVQQP